MTTSAAGGFASATIGAVHSNEKPHRHRKRRITFVVVALAALLVLLLRIDNNHAPKSTSLTSRGNSRVAKPHVAAPTTGLPGVICTGRNRTIARTPTKEDLKRLKRNAAKALKHTATGKVPKRPSEITGRRLPNGTFSGACNYGPQTPAAAVPGSNY
jgi:hypothetical protein